MLRSRFDANGRELPSSQEGNLRSFISEPMENKNQPLYLTIYQKLREDIVSQHYQQGERLPSEQVLVKEFDVSLITLKKAMEMLTRDGLIKRIPGKGSFVMEHAPLAASAILQAKPRDHTLLLGVVISDISASYGTELLLGIEAEASAQGCFIVLRRSLGQQQLEETSIEALLEIGVDGIIVMPVHGENYNPVILQQVLNKFPIVFVDRYLKGIPAPFVCTDNVMAAQKITNYVLDLGHRQLGLLSPPLINTSTILDRKEGFLKSHAERGLLVDESLWLTDLTCTMPDGQPPSAEALRQGIERVQALLQQNPQMTCLFCMEYNLAEIALAGVRAIGKRVPEDVSIICFDSPTDMIHQYFFTHIRQHELEMGATAVKLLRQEKEDPQKSQKIFLDTDLIIGGSTTALV